MAETIQKATAERQQEARRAFIEAAWSGDDADTLALADLAEQAGLSTREADRLAGEIQDLAAAVELARMEPDRHVGKVAAEKAHAAAVQKAAKLESQAETIRMDAGGAMAEAKRLWLEAERAVTRLAVVATTRPELLAGQKMPASVDVRLHRHEQEAARERAERVERQRKEHRRRLAGRVAALERELATNVLMPGDERRLELALANARQALDAHDAGEV